VANNRVLGVNSRSQVRRRGKLGLNQSLIYTPFPTLDQIFLFDHFRLISQKKFLGKKKILGPFSPLCPRKLRLCATEYFTTNVLEPIRNKAVFWPRAQWILSLQSKPRSGYYFSWASIVAEKLADFLSLFSIITFNNLNGPISLTALKRPERDVVHSPLSSTEVRNERSYTSSLHINLHGVHRDKLYLHFVT
jgi:hypothetical protein